MVLKLYPGYICNVETMAWIQSLYSRHSLDTGSLEYHQVFVYIPLGYKLLNEADDTIYELDFDWGSE